MICIYNLRWEEREILVFTKKKGKSARKGVLYWDAVDKFVFPVYLSDSLPLFQCSKKYWQYEKSKEVKGTNKIFYEKVLHNFEPSRIPYSPVIWLVYDWLLTLREYIVTLIVFKRMYICFNPVCVLAKTKQFCTFLLISKRIRLNSIQLLCPK